MFEEQEELDDLEGVEGGPGVKETFGRTGLAKERAATPVASPPSPMPLALAAPEALLARGFNLAVAPPWA